MPRFRRIALAALFAAAVPFLSGVGESGEAPVELGRQFKAMPWLEELGDAPYEVVKFESIPMLAGFPAKTAYYEIDPDVVVSGYGYYFYVRGAGRDYLAGSTFKLAILCRELEVVEELKNMNKGEEFAKSVGGVVKGMGAGLGNLVKHPGVSMKSMGSAFRSMGRSAERTVGLEDKIGRAESGVDRSQLGDGPAGDIRRALAYELGVDVYTDNPELRSLLTEMSQIKELGALTSWAVPYGLTMLDYFNPLGGDEGTEKLIRDLNPYDLRRDVGMRLGELYGLDREDQGNPLGRLLYNPNYTPREIAYIGKDLLSLAGVGNHQIVLELLAAAESPERADMMTLELRLYAFLNSRVTTQAAFVPFRHFFAAMGKDGVFRFMLLADTVRPWKNTADAFDEMIRAALAVKARGLEIWATGDIDPELVADARRRGVAVKQNILRDAKFFPAPEQVIAKTPGR